MRARRGIRFAALAGSLLAGAVVAVSASSPAAADNEPVIVVPGRPGVPVMMYGVDVSGAVIEGEWGLNRPGVVAPTVIMRYWPHGLYGSPGAYFPATGHRPRYGRLEVIPPPNRRLPTPAEPFHRDWSIQSAPGPATQPVPYDSPPVIIAPRMARTKQRGQPPVNPPAPAPHKP
jgi:hypothetical protein